MDAKFQLAGDLAIVVRTPFPYEPNAVVVTVWSGMDDKGHTVYVSKPEARAIASAVMGAAAEVK